MRLVFKRLADNHIRLQKIDRLSRFNALGSYPGSELCRSLLKYLSNPSVVARGILRRAHGQAVHSCAGEKQE